MNTIIENTTLEKIEKEIITLKNQTAENIILMGQKFIEAKKLVPHGGWGDWLESKVGFSQRTANQFMRIAKEYGSFASDFQFGSHQNIFINGIAC